MKNGLLLLGALAALGCGSVGAGGTPHSLRGLPPHADPPLDLEDDDDLGRARALYDALPLDDAARPARRKELVAALRSRIQPGDTGEGTRRLEAAINLWDARELDDPKKPPPDIELVAGMAEELFRRASTTGLDQEAVTALAVIRAAHPERAAEHDKTWKDILAYTNDLAVAEAGPGAERSRAIIMLEHVLTVFPSRWVGDKLVALYLERQEGIVRAISGGKRQDVVGAHRDPGVLRPVWNIVRTFIRLRRVADAAPVAARLAGQFGDEPELRTRLAAALEGKEGKAWIALMAAYVPQERGESASGDAGAALLVCEEGAARMPQAIEPRKCAAEIARVTDRVPLALRWADEARRLGPDDRDIAEITGRLYIARLADLAVAERIDAAAAEMKRVEAFYADADRRFKQKPLDITLSDALLTYGRGLYTQGHVEEGVAYLQRARKLDPSPDVLEELATVALKTGRYKDAIAGFEESAARPRATPIETTFDGNRLRRLAGEAAQLSGDRKKAEALWNKALEDWSDAMGASLTERARAQAYVEVGRLYYDLQQTDKSLQAMNAAIDADPEQIGVYGDVISFLVTRGHYPEALDAYHRALGRPEITEYLKAYTSLWMVDLAKLRGAEPDPLAIEMLGNLAKGRRWYHQLARFKLGQLTFDQLLAKADTRGRRAEAYFYEAMNRFARGDRSTGNRMLTDVVDTEMLGFFEYDMAKYFMKYGVPGKPKASSST